MSKTKELIICAIAIIALVLSITLSVSATSINDLLGNVDNQNIQTVPENTENENVNVIVPTTNNVANNNANNNTNNDTNVIPYTGTNSFSIIAIIAVCGVAAVYAYKKIRDYNNV